MSENSTYIIVHLDGVSNSYFNLMTMILLVIVVLVVCIFLVIVILGIVIYKAVNSKKSQRLLWDQSLKNFAGQQGRYFAKNTIEDSSSYNGVGRSISAAQEFDAGADSNAQSIPLATFRRHNVQNDRIGDSSESSSGLYDVLFPGKHEGGIICEPPKKLVTFAGQVYASGESSSRTHLIAEQSTSGVTPHDNATESGSLEWDYFQQESDTGSVYSESVSETQPKQTLCWV